ncbi:AIPR family protein [Planctomycetaceae bacterium SH139]
MSDAKPAEQNAKPTRLPAIQVELVHKLVMEIAEEWKEELDKLLDPESRKSEADMVQRRLALAFVHFSLKVALGISDEEAIACLTDGYRDFGIDAVHIGNVTDSHFEITIAQGKYVFDPASAVGSIFPENDGINVVIPSVRFIANPDAEIPANPRLATKIERIRSLEADGLIPRIRVLICNNGLCWTEDAQRRIDMENFGDHVEWLHVNPDHIAGCLTSTEAIEERLQWTGAYLYEKFGDIRALVGRMKVSELASLVNRHETALFDQNVRRFLGFSKSGSRVNPEVKATLMDESDRKNFYLYNNGLTIVCHKFDFNDQRKSDLMIQVTGPNVVNGGQTCRIIQQTHAEAAISGNELEDASVLVRLYEVPKDKPELASQIALSTNNQNPVDLRDLRSGDSIQRAMELAVQSYSYSYHRFRADKIVRGAKKIPAPLAAEAILAVWRKLPFEAKSHKKDHFSDKYYQRIFKSDLTAGQLILATKILRLCTSQCSAKESSVEVCKHGSHLIAMIVGGLLLSDTGVAFDQIQREQFDGLDSFFEMNDTKLFDRAVAILENSVKSFPNSGTLYSGSELSKLFRMPKFKGHVLSSMKGASA